MKCPHCNKRDAVNETDVMETNAINYRGTYYRTICVHCKAPIVVTADVRVKLTAFRGDHSFDDCDWPQYVGVKEKANGTV